MKAPSLSHIWYARTKKECTSCGFRCPFGVIFGRLCIDMDVKCVTASEYGAWSTRAIQQVRESLAHAGVALDELPGVDLDDIRSAAHVGIAEAVAAFDVERGKLSTHAIERAKYAILRELRDFYGLEMATELLGECEPTDERPCEDPDPPRSLIAAECRGLVRAAIARLPEDQRQIANVLIDGGSTRDIAALRQCSERHAHRLRDQMIGVVRERVEAMEGLIRGGVDD